MVQCEGYIPGGARCRIFWGLDALGYCHHHARQGRPRCQGFRIGTNTRCGRLAKPGFDYCSDVHDPATPYIPPRILDPAYYLRSSVQDAVVANYNGRDIYNQEMLDLITPSVLHLDHIGEKQCFTHALIQMGLRDGDEDLELVTTMLRDSVVNEVGNLALTRANTNRIKGKAVSKYLDDLRTGHLGQRTFTSYLLDEALNGEKLGRAVTGRITHVMGRALKRCKWKLADEGETPVLEQLSEQLWKLRIDMELH
ncbi:unnamed protein product [Phytophthora lilii]|uniref:Unnamed protein product n=1 Tax=Phytophthora lilii TaxID=2077276 RepID=A0A9W6TFW8_9STRA|nr:unnamed protein product [Phytophthora lilii]